MKKQKTAAEEEKIIDEKLESAVNKVFGMTHLMEQLKVQKSDILYFGDMTQPGGNDYPVVQMGIDTITVRSHEDTAYALRGILGILN